MKPLIYLHDNINDEQFKRIEMLFEHNLDMLKEENNDVEYSKVLNTYNNVLSFECIDKEELQMVVDFAQQEHYIFVENFVDENFNSFYNDQIKESFLLLRTLLCLMDKMK